MKNSVSAQDHSSSSSNSNRAPQIMGKDFDDVVEKARDIGENIKTTSKSMVKESVDFAKKYPVHTALGLGIVGYAIGALKSKTRH